MCITLQPKGCVNDRLLRLVTVYTHTLVLHGFMSDVMCARCNDIRFLARISDGSPFTWELSGSPCGQIFFNLVSIINCTPPFSLSHPYTLSSMSSFPSPHLSYIHRGHVHFCSSQTKSQPTLPMLPQASQTHHRDFVGRHPLAHIWLNMRS